LTSSVAIRLKRRDHLLNISHDITERKEAEEALLKGEKRFRDLAELLPETIFEMDLYGHLTFVSRSAFAQFKYTPEAFEKGLTAFDMIAPDDRERAMNNVRKIIKGEDLGLQEYSALRKDGTTFPAFFHSAVIISDGKPVGLRGFVIDISERKKVEVKLKESESKYQDLYEHAPDMFVSVDTKTAVIIECNQTLADTLGYTKKEIIDQSIFDIYAPDSVERSKKVFKKFVDVGKIEGEELQLQRKDGSTIDVLLNVTAFRDENGNILYSRSSWRDISEKKRLEAQLNQAQKMESIGTLAGGIAHDFNNILFPIIGFTEMTMDDVPEDSLSRKNLNMILKSALRARDLVQQILTFSRKHEQKLKPLKVQLAVNEALKLIRSSLPTTIEISQKIEKDCGLVMADFTQIHQIVMNLCTNAYHAMEETGGSLEVNLNEIELTIDDLTGLDMEPGPYLCLKVGDTGHGMDQSVKDRIFEPYFSTRETGKGTGLGLAVVHGIVKSYGGDIRVYSELGEGTVFHVYLPIIKESFASSEIVLGEPLLRGHEHVLVIDDETVIVSMEKEILERLGYQVTSRTSSIEALEAFREQPDKFDIVITDMTMPNMTGDKLAGEMIKIRPDIPIILCSGFSEIMSEEKAESLGIKEFLIKPIVLKDLSSVIRKVLDNKES